MKKKRVKRAKPRLLGRCVSVPLHVRMEQYRCPSCGHVFDRAILCRGDKEKVVKHWSKNCSQCGNRKTQLVGESNQPLSDGRLYTWDESEGVK